MANLYMKVLIMISLVTVFLLLIFSHLDWKSESTSRVELSADHDSFVQHQETSAKSRKSEKRHKSKTAKETEEDIERRVTRPELPSFNPARDTVNVKPPETTKTSVPLQSTTVPNAPASSNLPAWFVDAWNRSPTSQHHDMVGDQPLFEQSKCSSKNEMDRRLIQKFIEPKPYLPSAVCANPCWFEDPVHKRGFRCLPYFYIAGVPKCGTTDLFRRIRLHPSVMKGTMKEYHFWDRERFGHVEVDEDKKLKVFRKPWTFKEYLDKITGDDLRRVFDEIKTAGKSVTVFGDGSPAYLWDILHWEELDGNQGCDEPRVVLSQHIRHIYPASKIILIFRHPTPRLYSRFLSRIWRTPAFKGSTSTDFHNYVVKGVQLYNECFQKYSLRQCAYNYTIFDNAVVRLIEGMYPIFMADFMRVWPKENLLILRSEDYGTELNSTMEKVFRFLEVPKLNTEDWNTVVEHRLSNVGQEYENLGPILPETAKILDHFYQPFVDKFAEIMNEPKFLWKDTYPPPADQK